jgi:hypothetical protein
LLFAATKSRPHSQQDVDFADGHERRLLLCRYAAIADDDISITPGAQEYEEAHLPSFWACHEKGRCEQHCSDNEETAVRVEDA